MSLYWWNFEVKVIPGPPSGINQATPPPPPEIVSTAPTKVVNLSADTWLEWLTKVMLGSIFDDPSFNNQLTHAAAAGNLNLLVDPWPQAIRYAGGTLPPHRTIQLFAVASWEQIYSGYNTGNTSEYITRTKKGVTTSETESQTFGASVGVSVSAGWGPVSATMSAEFTTETSTSRTVTFTEEKEEESRFSIPAQSYVQIWQLRMHVRAGEGGSELTEHVQSFQTLTYPRSTQTMSREEAEAYAKKEAERLSGLFRR